MSNTEFLNPFEGDIGDDEIKRWLDQFEKTEQKTSIDNVWFVPVGCVAKSILYINNKILYNYKD